MGKCEKSKTPCKKELNLTWGNEKSRKPHVKRSEVYMGKPQTNLNDALLSYAIILQTRFRSGCGVAVLKRIAEQFVKCRRLAGFAI